MCDKYNFPQELKKRESCSLSLVATIALFYFTKPATRKNYELRRKEIYGEA
jgi:hypothetical protein